MALINKSFAVPFRDKILEQGVLTVVWQEFFRAVEERLRPMGIERSFTIVNNQSTPADITGMKFNSLGVSQALVTFLIQRITTGGGAVKLVESGLFIVTYNPTDDDWDINLVDINSPDNSGVDFTITSTGQVQYTSSNEGGTESISKLFWRASTLGGKNQSYSSLGKR